MADLAMVCINKSRSAPQFAQDAYDASGGTLNAEQTTCLQDRYAALSLNELKAVTQGAANPNDPNGRQESRKVTDQIYAACGVAPPAN
jgi:hypothetical protein